MKNKLNLITLILTMLFSFAVTSVVWAECEVTISPYSSVILPGNTLQLFAETTCDGVVQTAPSYTWEISEGTCTGGNTDPDTGTYTAGAEDLPCLDTIMVTDIANGGIVATATVTVVYCLPSVSISGPATLGLPCPVSATYTAETVVCDIVSGTYTWELDGKPAGTGNTFEVDCTETGIKVLTVTDTANGNISDSIVIACYCEPPIEPPMESTFEGCGRPFFYGFGVVTIQGANTIFGPFTTLSYDSPLVLPLPRLVNRSEQRITQLVILWPSILFPAWDYPAIVEVTVDGLSSPYSLLDTFIIPKCGQ
jgi:hypothetical protein